MNKILESLDQSLTDVFDGAVIMIGGFGESGAPNMLVEALRRKNIGNLTIISNGAGYETYGLGGLINDGRVKKLIASFPNYPGAWAFRKQYVQKNIELELVPQGTLAERIRAGGAGIGGFYTRTAAGTKLAEGKEVRLIDGEEYVFEKPLQADFALIKAHRADCFGNLSYRQAMRNFNMPMATAAKQVIAEVDQIVDIGEIFPEDIHTPSIFVDKVVQAERHPDVTASLSRKGGDKK